MPKKEFNLQYNFDITKTYEEEGNWIVEGLCATSDLDLQGDIITRNALELSAKDLEEYSTVLHNHNEDEAIGKVIQSESVEDGLWLKVLVSKTVPDIWQKIKEGVLNKFSIRGKVLEAKKRWVDTVQKFVKFILRMKLVEASIVAVPANVKAKTLRWYIEKAFDEYEKNGGELKIMEEKEFEQLKEEKILKKVDGSQEQKVKDVVLEGEELIEASGEPVIQDARKEKKEENVKTKEPKGSEIETKGFPVPAKLWNEWISFCKQNGYPDPSQYQYPQVQVENGNLQDLLSFLDTLIVEEEDPDILDSLQQIRAILNVILQGNPPCPCCPTQDEQIQESAAAKAAGKIRKDNAVKKDELEKKFKEIEYKIEKSFESAMTDLAKRIENLERAGGMSHVIKGQEDDGNTNQKRSIWKGTILRPLYEK